MSRTAIRVVKFGGSSLASAEGRSHALAIIERARRRGPVAVVVSALGGVTDTLAAAVQMGGRGLDEVLRALHLRALTESLGSAPSDAVTRALDELFETLEVLLRREPEDLQVPEGRDQVLSSGERASVAVMAALLGAAGVAVSTPEDAPIRTDSTFGNARPLAKRTHEHLQPVAERAFEKGEVLLLPGFIGQDQRGRVTTLGRGGSDYSGALVAAALGAERLEIWSDVDGLLAADPRWVEHAPTLPVVSYWEAEQLARFGARVLDRRTPRPLRDSTVPIHLRNTFRPAAPGTRVMNGPDRIAGLALAARSGYREVTESADGALVLRRPRGEIVQVRRVDPSARAPGPGEAPNFALVAALGESASPALIASVLAGVGITPIAEKAGGAHLILLAESDLPGAMVALHEGVDSMPQGRRRAS